jgi:hypothetical protein
VVVVATCAASPGDCSEVTIGPVAAVGDGVYAGGGSFEMASHLDIVLLAMG